MGNLRRLVPPCIAQAQTCQPIDRFPFQSRSPMAYQEVSSCLGCAFLASHSSVVCTFCRDKRTNTFFLFHFSRPPPTHHPSIRHDWTPTNRPCAVVAKAFAGSAAVSSARAPGDGRAAISKPSMRRATGRNAENVASTLRKMSCDWR